MGEVKAVNHLMALLIMLQQQIAAKIIIKISYYSVYMIRIVLRVIVFYNDGWALYSIITWISRAGFMFTCPCKTQVI